MALKLRRQDSEISFFKIPDLGSLTHITGSLIVTIFGQKILKFLVN
jgi:hypothetical protein